MNRLFIIGIGRSGSTILAKTIGKHSRFKYTPEIPIYGFFYHWNKGKVNAKLHQQATHYLDWYQTLYQAHPWVLDEDGFQARLPIQHYDEYMNQLFLSFHENHPLKPEQQEVDWIIDKNPSYTLNIEAILSKNDGDKCIFMVRDPRDNVASRIKTKNQQNTRNDDLVMNALRWNRFNAVYFKLKSKFNERIMLVKYEDFIENSDLILKEISTFLNVEFEAGHQALALYSKDYVPYLDPSIQKKYSDLDQPLNNKAINQWKELLTTEQQHTVEGICQEIMLKFGYPTELKSKPMAWGYRLLESSYWLKEKIMFYTPPTLKLLRIKSLTRQLKS